MCCHYPQAIAPDGDWKWQTILKHHEGLARKRLGHTMSHVMAQGSDMGGFANKAGVYYHIL